MSDDLYQEALVALAKSGAGAGRLDSPDGTATADNPLCGDRVTVDVKLDGDRIDSLAHKTRGCLLTRAAASLVAEATGQVTVEAASRWHAAAAAWLRGEGELPAGLEHLEAMAPVRAVKSRHDCVLIAFEALHDALAAAAARD